MEGGAMLDAAGGRIVGFAHDRRGAVAVELRLDGRLARTCIAAGPVAALGRGLFRRLGPPPTAICGFEMRLPRDAAGEVLDVVAGGETLLSVRWRSEREAHRYREGSEMADSVTIEKLRLQSGAFRARLTDHAHGAAAPEVALHVRGEEAGRATLSPQGDGVYMLSAPLPDGLLSDGVMVAEFRLADGSVLARYPLAAGAALAGDVAAEVASLRAELDQLKRAFRQTMAAGVIPRDERPAIIAEALVQVDHLLEMRDRVDQRQQAMAAEDLWADDDANWDIEQ